MNESEIISQMFFPQKKKKTKFYLSSSTRLDCCRFDFFHFCNSFPDRERIRSTPTSSTRSVAGTNSDVAFVKVTHRSQQLNEAAKERENSHCYADECCLLLHFDVVYSNSVRIACHYYYWMRQQMANEQKNGENEIRFELKSANVVGGVWNRYNWKLDWRSHHERRVNRFRIAIWSTNEQAKECARI